MRILEIKTDKNLFHHYLIGVSIHTITHPTPGKYFLKYGPIYYTNDDVQKIANVVMRCDDKVFPQTHTEASESEGCVELLNSVECMKSSCHVNQCSIHHFSSVDKFDDDIFVGMVKLANHSNIMLDKLKKAKI